MNQICPIWSFTDTLWSAANWLWSECQLVNEIVANAGVDATTLIQPWMVDETPYRAGELKKKRLIRLICKVKGIEYNEQKAVKDFKITTSDIKLVVKAVSGIDLSVNE